MTEKFEPFSGNLGADESPHDFLRTFHRIHLDTDEKVAISRFKYYVKVGHDADEWFAGLSSHKLANWGVFEATFEEYWPRMKRAVKSPEEYEDELLQLKLRDEDLGVIKMVGGIEVWSHIKWAHDAFMLATRAGISSSSVYIRQVRRELPDAIKDLIDIRPTDWVAFTKAVQDIDIDRIQDHVDRVKRDRMESDGRIRALLQSLQDANHSECIPPKSSNVPVELPKGSLYRSEALYSSVVKR